MKIIKRISFFIGSLETGGAERQLSIISQGLAKRGYIVTVITLYPDGSIRNEMESMRNINLISLFNKRNEIFLLRIFQLIFAPFKLRNIIKREDCVYSMLEITNFISWLAAKTYKDIKLIWGIRSTNVEGHHKMRLFDKLCAFVSSDVDAVIANSNTGLKQLVARGYRPKKHVVIHNGINTELYKFDKEIRNQFRKRLGLSEDQYLVGIIGRISPMKDHKTFIRAATKITYKNDNVKFLIVGGGSKKHIDKLKKYEKVISGSNCIEWLDNQVNLLPVYCSLDILVSSSAYGEGFSNVIGEAMACGVPCIVTNVGDSAEIVGNEGYVIQTGNANQLVENITELLRKIKQKKITANNIRKKIQNDYSIEKMLNKTESIIINGFIS